MAKKKIWLLQTWEPNPLDDPKARPWRTGLLARRLAEAGYQVTWWASKFAHNTKTMRGKGQLDHRLSDGLTIRLIPALGYTKHVSFARLKDHQFVAQQWLARASEVEKPDLIIASYPTIELCEAAVRWAKENGVPIFIDIRDQYPDLYWENSPKISQWAVKVLCRKLRRKAKDIFTQADGITANGPDVLRWALDYAGRKEPGIYDRALPMSYEPPELVFDQEADAKRYWANQMVGLPDDALIIAYTGMIGQTIEVSTVFAAARALLDNARIQFIFCGGGDLLEEAKNSANGLKNVHFTGWLDSSKIHVLLKKAHIGLVPYQSRANFEKGITNKPVEYLAHGLPILTSLQKGTLVELIHEYQCGWCYENGNPDGLVEIIRKIADQGEFNQIVGQAERLFAEKFHPDAVYGEWLKVINAQLDDR